MAKSGTGLQQGQDQYTYWSFPGSGYITLTVLNNAADVGFGTTSGAGGPEAADYPPNDEYYTPGTLIRPDKFDAIRIKNHIPGSACQYAIATRLVTDAPSDVPLGASFSPTYITVDPVTGAVGAQFTGNVNAQGIQVPTMEGAPPNQVANRIVWIRQSDGALTAQILGSEPNPGFGSNLQLTSFVPGTTATSVLQIKSNSTTDAGNNLLAFVKTAAGLSFSRTIIDGTGHSDFVQATGSGGAVTLGDPFLAYATGAQPSGSWGPGEGEHLESWFAGVSITVDPGGRHVVGSKAHYQCRNTGTYLVFATMSYAASTDGGEVSLLPCNLTSGYILGPTVSTASTIGNDGISVVTLIPASAGDILSVKSNGNFAFNPTVLGYNGGSGGHPTTSFGAVQIS